MTKQFGKDHREDPDSAVPPEVATVLYYGAILAALLRRGERITNLDDAKLCRGARWAVDQPWVDERTAALFREALSRLQPHSPA